MGAMTGRRLRIRQLRWEAERVLSLELERADGGELPPWSPGAHIDVHLPGAIIRQYSLCGTPTDRRRWRIAVLLEENSRGGSRAVHEVVRPGDELEVTGPRNNFPLLEADRYLFVAGGIGITPLLPMVGRADAMGADWRLAYGGRTRAGMAFADELCQRFGDRVSVVPQDELGLLELDDLLAGVAPDARVYCCGPEPLLTAVEERCPAGQLHVERFTARAQTSTGTNHESEFEVVLQGSGRRFRVQAGQSILEAMEAEGIAAPNSCREGICGTCETKVLDGIPDHRDSLLSEEERAANQTMMICVGRALSDRIVLDLAPSGAGITAID